MIYKILLCFCLILIFLGGNGQIPQSPINVPSPQAWNFAQYGKTPITHFTGLPDIGVNLGNVNQNGFVLPIQLQYNVASVRPDLHPGVTGLGWNLNLGGVISRKIRGLPDEFDFTQDNVPYYNGYRNSSIPYSYSIDASSILATTKPFLCQGHKGVCDGYSPIAMHQIPQILPFLWDNSTYMAPECWSGCEFYWLAASTLPSPDRWTKWNNSGGGIIDNSPDEFSFNVLGLNGKFRLPRGAETQVTDIVCNKKVRISLFTDLIDLPATLSPPAYRGPTGTADGFFFNLSPWQKNHKYPKTILGFMISDEDGNSYYFGKSGSDIDLAATQGFDNEAIEYGIDIYNISQDFWKADSWFLTRIVLANGKKIDYEYARGPFQTSMYLSGFDANTLGSGLSWGKFDRGGQLLYSNYLVRYYSDNFEVKLSYSNSTQLRYEDGNADVYQIKPGIPTSMIPLNPYWEYVTLTDIQWKKLDQLEIKRNNNSVFYTFSYNNISNERLMLQKVVESDGQKDIAVHKFSYNMSPVMPGYLSGQVDHWGYFNGRLMDGNVTPVNYYNYKEPDNNYLNAGVLTKIEYPTGGYTAFTFESNEYKKIVNPNRTLDPNVIPVNTLGGGLRIRKIEDYDKFTSMPKNVKEYFYKTGFSNSLSSVQIEQLPSSGVLNSKPQYYWTSTVPYYNPNNTPTTPANLEIISSQSLYPLLDDYQIGYSEVVERNTDNSYSILKFTNHDNGFKDEAYDDALNDVFNSPFTKYTSKSFERGKLLEKSDYNNNGTIVHKTTCTYKPSIESKPWYFDKETSYFNSATISPGNSYVSYTRTVLFGTAYKVYKYQFVPDLTTEYTYQNGSSSLINSVQYFYENPLHEKATKIVSTNSKGEKETTILKYPHDFDYTGNFLISRLVGKPGTLIEKIKYKEIQNVQKVVGGELYEYALRPNGGWPLLNSIYKLDITSPLDVNTFIPTQPIARDFNSTSLWGKSGLYKMVMTFTKYDQYYNPVDITKSTGERTMALMGNRNNNILATINYVPSSSGTVWAYTSFENAAYPISWGSEMDNTEDFSFSATEFSNDSYSGKRSFKGSVKTINYVNAAKIQLAAKHGGNVPIITLWLGGVNPVAGPALVKISEQGNWDVYEATYSNGGTKVEINSNDNFIDELRIYANSSSEMNTYTYDRGLITTVTDRNFVRTIYDYDVFDRLICIRDQNRNIIKQYDYQYQAPTRYYNSALSDTFTRINCGNGYQGGSYTYNVAAGKYSSPDGQEAADQLALDDLNANGQNAANLYGPCNLIYYNAALEAPFTRSCIQGSQPSTVIYKVAAGKYSSIVSQAVADQLATAEANANGQAYANANGTCTFYNTAKSGTLKRNNCTSGYTGSSVPYNIAAGLYSSIVSQADADQKALDAAQAYANANGTCTLQIYVRLTIENEHSTSAGSAGNIVVRFYSDAAGTVPVSVTNLVVKVNDYYNYGWGTASYDDAFTCTGTSKTIYTNITLQGEYYDEYYGMMYESHVFSLVSGAGYTIIN